MTALPATRALAMELVNGMLPGRTEWTENGVTRTFATLTTDQPTMDVIFALLKRGAETVGATEAWLYSPKDRSEQTTIEAGAYYTIKEHGEEDWEGEPDRPIVRRCLILPDDAPTQEEAP